MPPSSAGAVPQAHTDPYAPCPPTEAAPAKDGFVRLISETSPGRRRRDRHSRPHRAGKVDPTLGMHAHLAGWAVFRAVATTSAQARFGAARE